MPIKELKLDLKPLIKKFEVFTRQNVMGDLTGSYVTAIKGKGLEFDGFRPYSINDDASQIDWKASLRSQSTLVKKFVEERNLSVFFLIDVSNSMLFASTKKLKAEFAAELVASIAFAILQAGDYVGVLMFNDSIVKEVPLKSGPKHYYSILRQISNPENYGGDFDISFIMKYINGYIKRRALLVVVSDFIGMKQGWSDYFNIASKKFDIMPIMILDPHDLTLPEKVGSVVVEDPYTKEQMVIDPKSIKREYERSVRMNIKKIQDSFKKYRIPLLQLKTNENFVNPVMNYFKNRLVT